MLSLRQHFTCRSSRALNFSRLLRVRIRIANRPHHQCDPSIRSRGRRARGSCAVRGDRIDSWAGSRLEQVAVESRDRLALVFADRVAQHLDSLELMLLGEPPHVAL